VMWVESFCGVIESLPNRGISIDSMMDVEKLINLPEIQLGALTFLNLASLWWWYMDVIYDYLDRERQSFTFDLVVMVSFASVFRLWSQGDYLFLVSFVFAMILLSIRFLYSFIIVLRVRRENVDNTHAYNGDFIALMVGLLFIFLILYGSITFVMGGGSFPPSRLLILCLTGTAIAVILKYLVKRGKILTNTKPEKIAQVSEKSA